jgi:Domain of unknown function (DUF4145)
LGGAGDQVKPSFVETNMRADCPECGVPTTFEGRNPSTTGEFGSIVVENPHAFENDQFSRTLYKLFRCVVCSRPGIGKFHFNHNLANDGQLEWFWPTTVVAAKLPAGVPEGIVKEFREAELCLSAGAWRGAAALFRSALEKLLKANGYTKEKDLYQRIEAAATDGVITAARRQKAHDLVRTLGNDVLHDDWREVTPEEAEAAQHYVGRVIEDLFDDRPSVVQTLTSAGRIG